MCYNEYEQMFFEVIKMQERHILCIDLKSFFASVECIERGLDPFTTPLVVASKRQGNGAITLAVSPFLRKQGIKGRTRLYEIPKNISYQIVPPRMKLYLEKSKEVVKIYTDFVSFEDLHIYSIDECFLDVTDYLHYFKKTDYELAIEILKTIEQKTGLTATCGIGPNLLLAKISMDLEAKKYKNGIAKWTFQDVEKKLWPITPLSKVWKIGPRLEKRLNNLGIFTMGDLAHQDPMFLKKKFGIIGQELWEHANGIDFSRIKDFEKEPKEKSFSHSQVLFKDYYNEEIYLIFREMLEVLTTRLRLQKKETQLLGLGITYSKTTGGGFYHSQKIQQATDNEEILYSLCITLFDRFYEENMPIRKESLSLGSLKDKEGIQLNLFESFQQQQDHSKILEALDQVHERFGKNSVLKASSLLENSTIKDRNQKIGGHHE